MSWLLAWNPQELITQYQYLVPRKCKIMSTYVKVLNPHIDFIPHAWTCAYPVSAVHSRKEDIKVFSIYV